MTGILINNCTYIIQQQELIMNHSDLLSIWAEAYNHGYTIRINNLDGLHSYQIIKKKYQDVETVVAVKESFKQLLASILYTNNKSDTDHQNATITIGESTMHNNDPEIGHYFVQHFRIVVMSDNFQLKIGKLAQIAYNAGQLSAEWDRYPTDIQDFVRANKLHTFSSFV